jgi:hypothetical protein
MSKSRPYEVHAERPGCIHCGSGAGWDVVFMPTETGLSTTFDDKEEAEYMAQCMNAAYSEGLKAARRKP